MKSIREQLIELNNEFLSIKEPTPSQIKEFSNKSRELCSAQKVGNRKEWISAIELEKSRVLTASY